VRKAIILCALAFALRIAIVLIWPDHLWAYTVYYDMAKVLAAGGGYCLTPGALCAYFPPVYPTILAACILTGHPTAAIMFTGALTGAGTVWLTFLTGRHLFGESTGLLAAGYATVYPYFLWHDAVVQETATLTLVVAGAIYLLVRGGRAAGLMLALCALTKANLALFVPFALAWMFRFGWRRVLWATCGVMLLLGPWMARTWWITGSPTLYSNGGQALWLSNHAMTFDYFPRQSIDEASNAEFNALSPSERAERDAVHDPQGIAEGRWYWNKGLEFIQQHPWLTLRRAVYKVWIAFSPVFSPAKPGAFQWLYFVSYFPLFVLSCYGAWLSRKRWQDLGYIYLLIATFAIGCAVFWGHTSHRMYVEPYLMILSAHGIRDLYFKARRG
jgi:4-amino-4-deoxy-L-arabinose transferase-like glycosyltransferase